MAYPLRTATAINLNGFEPGDSIFKSTTLMGVFQECVELLDLSIASYNASNTLLPFPDISIDYAAGVCTGTIPIPYEKILGVQTPLNVLNSYSAWVTPTDGELEGITSLSGAYIKLLGLVGDLNDILRVGVIIQDARPTTTNNDDKIAKQYETTFALPYDTIVDAITGEVKKILQNFHVITDIQQGYPIA